MKTRISSNEKMDFKKYYTDPNFSGSFSGANTFYKALKGIDPSVDRDAVKESLKSSNPYTLHKQVKRPKKFRRVYTKGIKYLFQMDLIDIPALADENDGYNYLVTIIDTFSKFAWVFPTRRKTGKEVYDKIKALLLVERPTKIQTDKGGEFYNNTFKALVAALGIKHYSSGSHLKATIVERFNRTLKTRLERVYTFQGNHRYVEILPQVVKAYNNSYHRSIGMIPANVTSADTERILNRLYPNHVKIEDEQDERKFKLYPKKPRQASKPAFKVGDTVRITGEKNIYQKGYEQNWKLEVFKIKEVHHTTPITYELIDYKSEPIFGPFYKSELQAVNPQSKTIQKVVKTRTRRGKTEFLVQFAGYPTQANTWLTAKEYFNFNE